MTIAAGLMPVVLLTGLVVGQPGLPAGVATHDGFDADRALRIARGLVRIAPRRGPRDDGRQLAAEYCAALLRAAGARDVRITVSRARGHTWRSVEGQLPGNGADGALLLGAHLDAVPGSPGALDDAGGVGVVLELARHLSAEAHARDIEIRIWDGEEQGLLGSSHEARGRARRGEAMPHAVLVAEIVGRADGHLVLHSLPETWMTHAPAPVPAWLAATTMTVAARAGVAASYGDDLLSLPYQLVVHLCRVPFGADDGPFLERRVPALFVSDYSFSRPYPHYHRPTDTAARLDVAGLTRAGRALAATVAALDAAPVLPPWDERAYVALGSRVLAGPWLLFGLLTAGLPLLASLVLGRSPRRSSVLALVGYAAAAWAAPVPTACALALPAWAAGCLGALPWRVGRWLLLSSWLPGIWCFAVLFWAMAVYQAAMPIVAAPGFVVGLVAGALGWPGLVLAARVTSQ